MNVNSVNSIDAADCPANALAWAELHLKSPIIACQPLKGSTSSRLYLLTTDQNADSVLRLFTWADWIKRKPDLARHEAAVLEQAQQGDVHTPHLIAYDEFGENTTFPAVLMSRVSGAVNLHPAVMGSWLKQQAVALSKIHQLPTDHFDWHYTDWFELNSLRVPKWSKRPEVFNSLIEILKQPRPKMPHVFLHRDYHPTNVLWQNGELTGVVDWVNGCIGPAMIDVGHCRLNLASLFGVKEADIFLHHWRNTAGEEHYSAWWDICALANGGVFSNKIELYSGWADFNKTDITVDSLAHNLDAFAVSLLKNFRSLGQPQKVN